MAVKRLKIHSSNAYGKSHTPCESQALPYPVGLFITRLKRLAMPLTVQTNDSVTGANSYASVTDLTTYADSRGITLKGAPEQLLMLAMDVLESKQYKGEPIKADQSTKWPRMGLGIPRAIKQAQVMLAVSLDGAPPVNEAPAAQVSRERVDVIEVQYFEAKDNQSALLKMVDELLAPYLAGGGVGVNFRVYRG